MELGMFVTNGQLEEVEVDVARRLPTIPVVYRTADAARSIMDPERRIAHHMVSAVPPQATRSLLSANNNAPVAAVPALVMSPPLVEGYLPPRSLRFASVNVAEVPFLTLALATPTPRMSHAIAAVPTLRMNHVIVVTVAIPSINKKAVATKENLLPTTKWGAVIVAVVMPEIILLTKIVEVATQPLVVVSAVLSDMAPIQAPNTPAPSRPPAPFHPPLPSLTT